MKVTRSTNSKASPYLRKYYPVFITANAGMPMGCEDDDTLKPLINFKGRYSKWLREKATELELRVVDLGGGNGRNTMFLQDHGFNRCTLLDKKGDYGVQWDFNHQAQLPFKDNYADVILAQYVFMFLDDMPANRLLQQIDRIAKPGCFFVCEIQWLLENQETRVRTMKQASLLNTRLEKLLRWDIIHKSKYRFIARKP